MLSGKLEFNMMNLAQNVLGFGSIGWPEMLIVLIIALLIFGRRLPEVARSLGKSLNEFKKGMNETRDDIEKKISSEEDKDHSTSEKKN
jgi:sec-independent protein translocase protein TatA